MLTALEGLRLLSPEKVPDGKGKESWQADVSKAAPPALNPGRQLPGGSHRSWQQNPETQHLQVFQAMVTAPARAAEEGEGPEAGQDPQACCPSPSTDTEPLQVGVASMRAGRECVWVCQQAHVCCLTSLGVCVWSLGVDMCERVWPGYVCVRV